jgi:ABC-type Zn uptake system ZnuABC Zn-binding protein ZnuA
MSWTVTQAVEKLQKIAEGFHSNHSTRKDIQEVITTLTNPDMILIEWGVEDVYEKGKEKDLQISEEDARELLSDMAHKHDASIGINWDVIDAYLDNPGYNAKPIEYIEED